MNPEINPITQPIQEPSLPPSVKKSRKKLVIGLIITAVVLIAAVIGTLLFVNNTTSQAREAAAQYRKDVLTHLDKVTTIETYKERIAIWRDTAQLKNVQFGESLSKEYKDALDLKKRYESLIAETYPTVLDRYASTDINPFLKDVTTTLNTVPPLIDPKNKDLKVAVEENSNNLDGLKTKQKSVEELTTRLKSYVYPESIRTEQDILATKLETLAKEIGLYTVAQNTYVESLKERLASQESDSTKAPEGMDERKQAAINGLSTAQNKFFKTYNYAESLKSISTSMNNLVKAIDATNWMTESRDNVLKVGEKVDAMRDELK